MTIDNSDYVFAAAFDRVSETGNTAGAERIAAAYIDYMEAVTAYYEQQAVAIVGRDIAQTLLIHANALNAATLDRLAARLEARRYRFVPLDRALRDPAYELPDTYSGPGGITWLHRWAITARTPPAVFKGEPEVPEWINSAAALRLSGELAISAVLLEVAIGGYSRRLRSQEGQEIRRKTLVSGPPYLLLKLTGHRIAPRAAVSTPPPRDSGALGLATEAIRGARDHRRSGGPEKTIGFPPDSWPPVSSPAIESPIRG